MSMETVMLLSASSAMQGWFMAQGRADEKGSDALGNDEGWYHQNETTSQIINLAGRIFATLPYFAAPRLVEILAQAASSPLYLSGGLLVLNVIPTVFYLANKEENPDLAALCKTVSSVMSVAMQVLNLFMIGVVISTSTAPVGAGALMAGTLYGALSLASIAKTTYLIIKE
jgi:hypothetical protein